jgi:hypothetical protein
MNPYMQLFDEITIINTTACIKMDNFVVEKSETIYGFRQYKTILLSLPIV